MELLAAYAMRAVLWEGSGEKSEPKEVKRKEGKEEI